MNWTLPAPTHFSLDSVVYSHGWSQLEPFLVGAGSPLSCVLELPAGRAVEVSVMQKGRSLHLSTTGRLRVRERSFVEERIAWMLRLDEDLRPFYDAAARERNLAHVRKRRLGRMLRSSSLFEDVTKTILTTNTTWSGTRRMVSRLVDICGLPVSGSPERKAFPSPERVVAVGSDRLREEVGMGYRAPYVFEVASSAADGSLDLEALGGADLPTGELRKQLLAIKGVGPYAAATLLMLLGRYDSLPVDSWALKLVSDEWYGGAPVGKAEVEAAFEEWGEWKALAYWFWDWKLLNKVSE